MKGIEGSAKELPAGFGLSHHIREVVLRKNNGRDVLGLLVTLSLRQTSERVLGHNYESIDLL